MSIISFRGGIFAAALSLFSLSTAHAIPPADSQKPLQIYFVDVEGGQATLFVTPAGQSLLVDTGWPGYDGRDADRIVAAARDAGIKKIDFVLLTHYHRDHAGGVPQLAARIPIGAFLDHGENREHSSGVTYPTHRIPANRTDILGFPCRTKRLATRELKFAKERP